MSYFAINLGYKIRHDLVSNLIGCHLTQKAVSNVHKTEFTNNKTGRNPNAVSLRRVCQTRLT